jgi:UDP:flavonoid glycosyltransferase YjiC (YdhE family)
MRVLFTFVGGTGHFEPLVPLVRAAIAAGHTVAVGCGSSMAERVEAAGFTTFVIGLPSSRGGERRPLQQPDMERELREFHERFIQRGAPYRVLHTTSLCQEWRPDVLVCDETDFGGMIAAERLGLPYATVLVLAAGSFLRPEAMAAALDELRAAHGLPPDQGMGMLSRQLVISPFPPSFRDPDFPLPATAHSIRPPLPREAGPTPAWAGALPGAPVVYFTLGTVFNMESGDLFTRVLEGLRSLALNVLVTVGSHIDPAEYGPQPTNVTVERFIPQAEVLPHCALVVSHGGSGSVIGALAHGLPMVVLPMGADQPHNAARCVDLGVGRALDPMELTPEQLRLTVSEVLRDPGYRQAARRMRNEIAALPEPAHGVRLLERLAVERRPIVGFE